jgi:PAS domain-containing protein
MRLNLPVIDKEFPFPAGETLVSTTDLKGRILYCNPPFISVSGFSKEELRKRSERLRLLRARPALSLSLGVGSHDSDSLSLSRLE